jgi:exosortase A-associated hydrolase 2
LAADAARKHAINADFLFWQPQVHGRQVLQQFLRLRMASELSRGGGKGSTARLQEALDTGTTVEVAGYQLSPRIAGPLSRSELLGAPLMEIRRRLVWLEVTAREAGPLLPVSTSVVEAWRTAGFAVDSRTVPGPSFWQTVDIEEAPELTATTVDLLSTANAEMLA